VLGAGEVQAYIYKMTWQTRLVISDVDGTVTRSDMLGHVSDRGREVIRVTGIT